MCVTDRGCVSSRKAVRIVEHLCGRVSQKRHHLFITKDVTAKKIAETYLIWGTRRIDVSAIVTDRSKSSVDRFGVAPSVARRDEA